jgi:hypothetical protein
VEDEAGPLEEAGPLDEAISHEVEAGAALPRPSRAQASGRGWKRASCIGGRVLTPRPPGTPPPPELLVQKPLPKKRPRAAGPPLPTAGPRSPMPPSTPPPPAVLWAAKGLPPIGKGSGKGGGKSGKGGKDKGGSGGGKSAPRGKGGKDKGGKGGGKRGPRGNGTKAKQ